MSRGATARLFVAVDPPRRCARSWSGGRAPSPWRRRALRGLRAGAAAARPGLAAPDAVLPRQPARWRRSRRSARRLQPCGEHSVRAVGRRAAVAAAAAPARARGRRSTTTAASSRGVQADAQRGARAASAAGSPSAAASGRTSRSRACAAAPAAAARALSAPRATERESSLPATPRLRFTPRGDRPVPLLALAARARATRRSRAPARDRRAAEQPLRCSVFGFAD